MLETQFHREPYRLAVTHWEHHFEREGIKAKRGGPKFDKSAQRFEDPYIRGIPFEPKNILHGSLADYLACCVQCSEFQRGTDLYERVGGKMSLTDSRIQTDIHLGYWLCKHGARGHIPAEACGKIGERVLRSCLQGVWLNRGQYVRAATWLKIVAEFAEWALRPQQVIFRSYEFMPDVEKPILNP